MKRSIFLVIATIIYNLSFAQGTEFERPDNGLIYPDSTINKLKFIVDSLNIRFRTCELSKAYKTKAQARAHYIDLTKGNIKAARRDIMKGISFDAFFKKYPKAFVDSNILVVRSFVDYFKNGIEFTSMLVNSSRDYEIPIQDSTDEYKGSLKGKWVFSYEEKSKGLAGYIRAFYIVTGFECIPLPDKYAKLVQYVDRMIDTSSDIFTENAKANRDPFYFPEPDSPIEIFLKYAELKTGRPIPDDDTTEAGFARFEESLRFWDSVKLMRADSLKKADEKFNQLFALALDEAFRKSHGDDDFEAYVGRCASKQTELQLKRNRIVEGFCSMDDRPRMHALNIAILSAETANWEIFLRSHLDIMNDNFQRFANSSYAMVRRKTYIKELELLNINIIDLVLGISLRIENPPVNHYYGSIGRLGRALSESRDRESVEARILDIIRDNTLDDYNRIRMLYLYLDCTYSIDNKGAQKDNIEKLKSAVKTLPAYLAGRIEFPDTK